MKLRVNWLGACSIALLLNGCAQLPTYNVSVDAMSDPDLKEKKLFILIPANENVDPSDLMFKEFL